MRHFATAVLLVGIVVAAGGLFIFFTERGVANEIKGFVLMLIGAVLFVGGSVLRELRALRDAVQAKNPD